MRVITFTSLFPNAKHPSWGIFIFQRMAHFAHRAGNSVVVVAPVPYLPAWLTTSRWKDFAGIPSQERIGGLEVYHPRYLLVPKVSMPLHGLLMFLGCIRLLVALQRQYRFECIDAHYVYPDGFAAALASRVLRLPLVVSARGTDMNVFPSFRLIRPMIRWTLRNAAGRIAVCNSLKQAIMRLGLCSEDVRVIGNGVDLERFSPVDRGAARQQLRIPCDAEMVLSVASLVPVKGFQFLIPAIARLAPEHPKLKLYIVGEGPLRPELESLAQKSGVGPMVIFAGLKRNEELKFWYGAANVCCLASSQEGWPNVLLESLACGTPVVATRVSGIPEVINAPTLGVLVDQSSDSLAEALKTALDTQWCPKLMVQYARNRTWDVTAREVEDYLHFLLTQPRS